MLGAIIGDIVGSRFEFSNTKDYDFQLFTNACNYTDDTICTIAVADAIRRDIGYKQSLLEWCRRYPHPMGAYGCSFQRWIFSADPHPYGSFGNGAAMRVSAVAWAFESEAEILREAMKSAACTHNHVEGLIGATAVAMGIKYMTDTEDQEERNELIDMLMEEYYGVEWEGNLPKRGTFDETCQGCVPLAFHILKQSTSFEDAIRKAVSYGGDTDTVGAIVGALAEPAFGIPEHIAKRALEYLPEEMKEVVKYINPSYNL